MGMAVEVSTLGLALDSQTIQTGLRELNKDLAFDVAVNRPGDWESVLRAPPGALNAIQKSRLPVMYANKYIVALDRGMVPEFKQFGVVEQVVEIPWSDADSESESLMAGIAYMQVAPHEVGYLDLMVEAMSGKRLDLTVLPGGIICRRVCRGLVKVRGRVLRVGWRHTFERLVYEDIPGISRKSLGDKFKVDMLKYPMGTPDELISALVEE
jgi:hypothetical protein